MLEQDLVSYLLVNPPETLADKIAATVGEGKIPTRVVAQECGVTVQAVNNWRKNGRVDKKHIRTLAGITSLPIAWWMPGYNPDIGQTFWPFNPWVSYTEVSSLKPEDIAFLAGRLSEALRDLKKNT